MTFVAPCLVGQSGGERERGTFATPSSVAELS